MLRTYFSKYFPFVITLLFIILFFLYRDTYTTRYDEQYLRDLYDHSQWTMPIPRRTIGDDGLYQVAGLDLVKTWDYFKINPEVPPLGKYLYGISILIFKNAQIISLLLLLISTVIFYKVAQLILKDKFASQIATILFLCEPVIFYQATVTMLDLPQLIMLLLHIYLFLLIIKNKNTASKNLLFAISAGIFLGFFMAVKIGFLAFVIVLADIVVLFLAKRIFFIIPIILAAVLSYTTTYLPYLLNHSPVEFLKTQKWMMNFYLTSQVKPLYGVEIVTLLTGYYRNWTGIGWEKIPDWTIMWPIYTVILLLTLGSFVRHYSKDKVNELYLIIVTTCLFLLYLVIPFWPRYLVLLIPLMILITIHKISKLNLKIISLLAVIFIAQLLIFTNPSPHSFANAIETIWKNGAYQDMYGSLDPDTQKKITREDYWYKLQLLEYKAGIKKRDVNIEVPAAFYPWQKKVTGNLSLVYYTDIGKMYHKSPIQLQRYGSSWRILWNDELFFPQYSKIKDIVYTPLYGRYGTITKQDGTMVSYQSPSPFVVVFPEKIQNESKLQENLSRLVGLNKFEAEYLYKANNYPTIPVEIGFVKPEMDISKVHVDPGILITQRNNRTINKDEDGAYMAAVSQYPQANPIHGGKIEVTYKNGIKKVLLEKKPVDGIDILSF